MFLKWIDWYKRHANSLSLLLVVGDRSLFLNFVKILVKNIIDFESDLLGDWVLDDQKFHLLTIYLFFENPWSIGTRINILRLFLTNCFFNFDILILTIFFTSVTFNVKLHSLKVLIWLAAGFTLLNEFKSKRIVATKQKKSLKR